MMLKEYQLLYPQHNDERMKTRKKSLYPVTENVTNHDVGG